jgi:acetoin utilization deacetylase AcuC-like enzyme
MPTTGVVIDPRYLEHDTGRGHPERPARIAVLEELVRGLPGIAQVSPRPATPEELTLVHAEGYFDEVQQTRDLPAYAFDPDTHTSARSFDTACLAAGGLLAVIDEVIGGRFHNGFAFVRPPGHHAERGRAMGFCLFNNVAVGAAYLRARHGLDRVAIIDWDVHHGNGTQHAFEADPHVLFVSTHQYPFYPGTGAADEIGRGEGAGFTVNLPFPAGFGDAEYLDAFRSVVVPVIEAYAPQFILISAGFDPHVDDPLGGMHVTEAGFAAMTRAVVQLAERSAGGRCVGILEGAAPGSCSMSFRATAAAWTCHRFRAEPDDCSARYGACNRRTGVFEEVESSELRVVLS